MKDSRVYLDMLISMRGKLSTIELVSLLDEINRQLKDNIVRK